MRRLRHIVAAIRRGVDPRVRGFAFNVFGFEITIRKA